MSTNGSHIEQPDPSAMDPIGTFSFSPSLPPSLSSFSPHPFSNSNNQNSLPLSFPSVFCDAPIVPKYCSLFATGQISMVSTDAMRIATPTKITCLSVFPLTLDVDACLEEAQKRQQQWACKHNHDEGRSSESINKHRSTSEGAHSHQHQLHGSSGANSTIIKDSPPSSCSNSNINSRHLYPICTKLKVVLQKKLTATDISAAGRIILPKKEAEANLPTLSGLESIILVMRDVVSSHTWKMKYRYWPNNKSRMYVLENTGDFVREKKLKCGDFIIIHQDDNKQNFISAKKSQGLELS